ncbi:magnesium/cobalt transporter CorA [Paenibacillus ginsengihumi]|uniref:magnesium/cobalt transporter CorA n=1 Tax=Paenibacillus ginsengihumi TaxID=431596 RepID=UPI0003817C55|nr:magnesium/cobalt transporter CorA [Paenibacillus ginsengihumi]
MIRALAVTTAGELLRNVPLERLSEPDIRWYWVDLDRPAEEETALLASHFRFHPLAIEDCLHLSQRAKLDHYGDVHFFVLHAIHPSTLEGLEVDLFVGPDFVVSFHLQQLQEIDDAWDKMTAMDNPPQSGPLTCAHQIMDKLVDQYFPSVYALEDEIGELEHEDGDDDSENLLTRLFEIRSRLLKLRRIVVPMRDLLYRIVNSQRIAGMEEHAIYFQDIHDHLWKLSDMIEQNRDITADIRDSYMSLNSNRMNRIMKTLTVITTIFMPLTFVAGIYGMNFTHMPELEWRYGYGLVLCLMAAVGLGMFYWFYRKGWFD